MGALLFLTAVILIQGFLSSADPIPKRFVCPLRDGVFAHPDDCQSYYKCVAGVPLSQRCSAPLHFNPITNNCDWPLLTTCSKDEYYNAPQGLPAPAGPVGPIPKEVVCPVSECACRIPDPCSCDGYYECKTGKPVFKRCSTGLYFNPETEVCDHPKNVKCEAIDCSVTTPEEPPTTTTQEPTTTTTEEPTTTTTQEPTTTTTEEPTTTTTQEPTTTTTEEPTTTTTQEPTTTTTEEPTTTTTQEPTTTTTEEPTTTTTQEPTTTTTEEPTTTTTEEQTTTTTEEPTTTTTQEPTTTTTQEPTTTTTEEPTTTTTQEPTTTTTEEPTTTTTQEPTTTTTEEPTTTTTQEPTTTTTEEPTTTTTEEPTTTTTQEPTTTTTEEPTTTTTQEPTTTTQVTCPTNPEPTTCPVCRECTEEEEIVPADDKCKCYKQCKDGKYVTRCCPDGLYFSRKSKTCGKVNECDTPPTCPCKCCLVPDPCDCTKYYICEHGVQTHQQCGEGLVFDPVLENCNWAYNVDNGTCCSGPVWPTGSPVTVRPTKPTVPAKTTRSTKLPTTKATRPTRPATPSPTRPNPTQDGICINGDGHYPHPTCTKFYHCSNGIAYVKDCPSDLHWSVAMDRCEYPCTAGCDPWIVC